MRGKALHPGTHILLKKPWEKLPRGEDPLEGRPEEKNAFEPGGEEFNSIKGNKSLIIPGSWSQRLVLIV